MGAAWWFVVLAIINSAIGTVSRAFNAVSRVIYTMAKPERSRELRAIHPPHRTPACCHRRLANRRLGIDPSCRLVAEPRLHLFIPARDTGAGLRC